jgi:alpha-L-fucosidase
MAVRPGWRWSPVCTTPARPHTAASTRPSTPRRGAPGSCGRAAIEGFREDAVDWTRADYRFTQRDRTLYAFQMRWPEDHRAVIRSLRPDEHVQSVRLLGGDRLPFQQAGGVLVASLPQQPPAPYANCLAINL